MPCCHSFFVPERHNRSTLILFVVPERQKRGNVIRFRAGEANVCRVVDRACVIEVLREALLKETIKALCDVY